MRAPDWAHHRLFGTGLETILLARHRWLDAHVQKFLSENPTTQVVELAAGLSGRGRIGVDQFPSIDWWETDLPGMIQHKIRILDRGQRRHPRRHHGPVDAFAASGGLTLHRLMSRLHAKRPLLILSEGLLNYFGSSHVEPLWKRIAHYLAGFPSGLYLTDVVGEECLRLPTLRPFRRALSVAARGKIHLHYRDAETCEAALRHCGFAHVQIAYPDTLALYRMVAAGAEKVS